MRIILEKRTDQVPMWYNIALPFAAVAITLFLCSWLIILAGAKVSTAYGILFGSAFGSLNGFAEVLVKAAPLTLAALAVAVAFRSKFWNIGVEGQLIAGAIGACWIGSFPMPHAMSFVSMCLVGGFCGAIIALIPATLRIYLKVDDVVSSLLLNSIVYYIMMALIESIWQDPFGAYPISPPITDEANFIIIINGTRTHMGVVVAFTAAILVWLMMRMTVFGFYIRTVGENATAAAYAGINVKRIVLLTALVSGALGGLAGVGEVGGIHFQVMAELSGGFGYTGIVVATLARLNPLGIIPSALFFATVTTGADAMSRATGVPVFLAQVIEGLSLMTMLVALLFTTYRLRFIRNHTTESM